ncbi:MAG: tetratricopeptide repeat protein [Rhodocyclaceae bacterium]|nr:tetratricopeptide repeat protein [Rhodocyclaceae bacterium]
MSSHAYDVNLDDFEEKVLATSCRVPVLVDFWAEWCQPCRILKPMLEKLAAEYGGRFILAKVNSDHNQPLAQRYGVRGIPAVKAFINGHMVDEFTGALPEGQVRDFLDKLIPSPAEPLRLDALAARQQGNLTEARRLMAEALALDPQFEDARLDLAEMALEAQAFDDARQVLDTWNKPPRDTARLDALRARLAMAEKCHGVDTAALEAQLAADPTNLDARLALAHTQAFAGSYRPALENLLEIVRRDRKWNDEAGRKGLLELFTLLAHQPEHNDLLREFRAALSRTLN